MSDSRSKENAEPAQAPDPRAGKPSHGLQNRQKKDAQPVNAEPRVIQEPKGKTWPIWLLSAMVIAALAGFAWIIASQMLLSPRKHSEPVHQTAAPGTDSTDGDNPISILPDENGGVTIMEKQAEQPSAGTAIASAPVAQGADIAQGFAMDLGAADSFLELSRRFATVAAVNGPENFQRLEPRAVLRDTVNGLEARLLVGPFETAREADEACAVLVLDPNMNCETANFEGELIPRE